jgi:hypothetical protein
MFAVGCVQAQSCHTGTCPTGVTTQDPVRQRALVVPDKAERVYRFHQNTVHALAELVAAAGLRHPGELRPHHIMHRVSPTDVRMLSALLPGMEEGELLGDAPGRGRHPVYSLWWDRASPDRFAPDAPARDAARPGLAVHHARELEQVDHDLHRDQPDHVPLHAV